jgi:hypothetical protein
MSQSAVRSRTGKREEPGDYAINPPGNAGWLLAHFLLSRVGGLPCLWDQGLWEAGEGEA